MATQTTVVTIGNFDGVHRGHAALIDRCRSIAGEAGRVVALVFDPHPASVLRPEHLPPRLTTFQRRSEVLRSLGADEVYRLVPDPKLLRLTAEEFLTHLVRSFGPVAVVEGSDFRFGRGRGGDLDALRELGTKLGFDVVEVEDIEVALGDQSLVRASSTLVRWLIGHGRVRDASAVLGRPYRLAGPVARGDRLGRRVGFPTANIDHETSLPADGVYAATAVLPDGRRLPAAVNVGGRPTVSGQGRRVEAHILGLATSWTPTSWTPAASQPKPEGGSPNWSPIEGLGEYGWRCVVELNAWLRDQMKFGSVDELTGQLARDCTRAAEFSKEPAADAGTARAVAASPN